MAAGNRKGYPRRPSYQNLIHSTVSLVWKAFQTGYYAMLDPVNKDSVLPKQARVSPDMSGRRSDHMLSQLLALNEDMIVQLRVERTEAVGTPGFITGMIEQHERAAQRLRAQLKGHKAKNGGLLPGASLDKPITC
jgi:hypothetical protein